MFKFWLSRPIEGKVRFGSFAQDYKGRWFVNLVVESSPRIRPQTGKECGIDLGLKTLATLSDGVELNRENLTRKFEKQLAIAQRARKKKRVTAIHTRIKNKRKDWNHKASTRKVPISKIPGVITDTLSAWLGRLSATSGTETRPFFMMVNLLDPHLPHFNQINGQPALFQPGGSVPIFPFVTDPKTINANDVAGHYNDVARLDGVFGTFIANLKKQGLYDNSLIIVIGDNGPDFDRAKATCYEAGLRVPMLVKMPGQTTGQTTDELVSTLDIFPTVAEALKLPVANLNLQGIALQKLTGKTARREYSYGEFIFHSNNHLLPTRSVKDKQYKLIVSPLTSFYAEQLTKDPANFKKHPRFPKYAKMPAIQLYDLKADPNEKINRAGDPNMASIQKRLEEALRTWQRNTTDSLFTPAKLKNYEPEIVRILNQPVTPSKGE